MKDFITVGNTRTTVLGKLDELINKRFNAGVLHERLRIIKTISDMLPSQEYEEEKCKILLEILSSIVE